MLTSPLDTRACFYRLASSKRNGRGAECELYPAPLRRLHCFMLWEVMGVTSVKEQRNQTVLPKSPEERQRLQLACSPAESGSLHHWGSSAGWHFRHTAVREQTLIHPGEIVFFLPGRDAAGPAAFMVRRDFLGIFSGFTEGSLSTRESLTHPQACQGGTGMTWMQLLLELPRRSFQPKISCPKKEWKHRMRKRPHGGADRSCKISPDFSQCPRVTYEGAWKIFFSLLPFPLQQLLQQVHVPIPTADTYPRAASTMLWITGSKPGASFPNSIFILSSCTKRVKIPFNILSCVLYHWSYKSYLVLSTFCRISH